MPLRLEKLSSGATVVCALLGNRTTDPTEIFAALAEMLTILVLPYCRDMIEVHAISSPCEVVRLTHLAWLTLSAARNKDRLSSSSICAAAAVLGVCMRKLQR